MSQVRKTIFTILALMLGSSLISGCGIQGDLYDPDTAENAVVAPQSISKSASQPALQADDAEATDTTEHAPVVE
ncbi:MAG: putative small lipoprotein YifL [Moritella sp.]|jgi:predicted small lipoprotein YifL